MMLWMVYSLLVGLLLTLAAHGAERVLRLQGRATRWVWLAAIVLSFGLPALLPWLARVLASDGAGILVPSTATIYLALPAGVVAGTTPVISWSYVLVATWLAASSALLLYGGWSLVRLQRSRRTWRATTLLREDVLMSRDLGPAVVGVIEPAIVLPEWVGALPEPEQALILAHERAHIDARDPWLVRVSQMAPLVAPWNVLLWLQSRRLRECVELDCDARLLSSGQNANGYAELLLNVGERANRITLAAAMAEPRSLLEKRIRRMFERKPRRTLLPASAWTVVALIALFAAFNAPLPANPLGRGPDRATVQAVPVVPVIGAGTGARVSENERATQSTDKLLQSAAQAVQSQVEQQQQQEQQPTFTPFTVPPELRNVVEVRRALEAFYPPLLRDANIGGSVKLWFYIDATGVVKKVLVKQSSGHVALDDAALKVADVMLFTPALNREEKVAVWVDMPIVFRGGGPVRDTVRQVQSEPSRTDDVPASGRRASVPAIVRENAHESGLPALANGEVVARALQRFYPPLLRDAGIGGDVLVWLYVDEQGKVSKMALKKGSGHEALDDAALRVAELMLFVPAVKDGKPVSAWIDLPISFRTN